MYTKKRDKVWYERHRHYRNKINILINNSKRSHLRSSFQTNLDSSKLTWSKIKNILNKGSKKHGDMTISENGRDKNQLSETRS